MLADRNLLKYSDKQAADDHYQKRKIYERNQRFKQNQKDLNTTDEHNRDRKKLAGPSENNMEKYRDEIQKILKMLKDVSIEELYRLSRGQIKDKKDAQKLLDIYFLILDEINKMREKMQIYKHINDTPGEHLESKRVLFLTSDVPEYFMNDEENDLSRSTREKDQAPVTAIRQKVLKRIKKFKTVLMLYFPEMPTMDVTENSSSYYDQSERNDSQRQTIDHDNYTPFLVELDPKNYKVKLYHKSAPVESEAQNSSESSEEEDFLSYESKYIDMIPQTFLNPLSVSLVSSISSVCIDMFKEIAKDRGERATYANDDDDDEDEEEKEG